MMVTPQELIERSMLKEYLISPPKKCIDTIVNAGLKVEYREEISEGQRDILYELQMNIRGSDLESQITKVFALFYPYVKILGEPDTSIKNWSRWLGGAEYDLANNKQLTQDYLKSKSVLLEKSIEHLLTAREKGDNSPEVTKLIVDGYVGLEKHSEALNFLLGEWDSGDKSPENAGLIHTFITSSGEYERGLSVYLMESEPGKRSPENKKRILDCYAGLEDDNKALDFLLGEWNLDDKSKENATQIHDFFISLKEYKKGLDFYLRERELGDKSPENARLIDDFCTLTGEHKKVRDFYLKEWELDDKTPSTFNSIIYFYRKLEEYEQAVNWFKENKESVDKIIPGTVYSIAKCHYMLTEQEKEKLNEYNNKSSQELLKLRSTGKDLHEINDYKSEVEKKRSELGRNVLNKLEEALGWVQKAEELGFKGKENVLLIGLINYELGKLKGSADYYETSLNYYIRAMALNGNTA